MCFAAVAPPQVTQDPLSTILQLGFNSVLGGQSLTKDTAKPGSKANAKSTYGTYVGQLAEDKTATTGANYYNIAGSVYALNEHTLVIEGFTFQPGLFGKFTPAN